jgi:hypothetical protein
LSACLVPTAANADLFLQNEREISAGLVEKLLKLEPSGSMLFAGSSLIPISRYPTRWSKNGLPWERLEPKKKSRQPQQVVDSTFAERARR